MSWSFSAIGKPENIAKALDEHSATLSGQSKVEFDDALPHLKALALQNFNNVNPEHCPNVRLEASGHGSGKVGVDGEAGEQNDRNFRCVIEAQYTKLV
jgi:hypothetical protein